MFGLLAVIYRRIRGRQRPWGDLLVTADRDNDRAYIYFHDPQPDMPVRRSEVVPGRVWMDFDRRGRMYGLKVDGAVQIIPRPMLDEAHPLLLTATPYRPDQVSCDKSESLPH